MPQNKGYANRPSSRDVYASKNGYTPAARKPRATARIRDEQSEQSQMHSPGAGGFQGYQQGSPMQYAPPYAGQYPQQAGQHQPSTSQPQPGSHYAYPQASHGQYPQQPVQNATPGSAAGYSGQGRAYAPNGQAYHQPHAARSGGGYIPSVKKHGMQIPRPTLLLLALTFVVILALLIKSILLMWVTALLAVSLLIYLQVVPYARSVALQSAGSLALALLMAFFAVMGGSGSRTGQPGSAGNPESPQNQQESIASVLTTHQPTAVPTAQATIVPTAAPTAVLTAMPTQQPTAVPQQSADQNVTHDGIALNMQLFYNTDGGSFYHVTDSCTSVNSKYLPLIGRLIYSELDDSKYKRLKPCPVCLAPVRPHSH